MQALDKRLVLIIFMFEGLKMAVGKTSFNMVELLKEALEREVKHAVTEEIVKKEMEELEVKIREQIKPIVSKISFDRIETVKEVMDIRDELHVYLHMDNDQPETKELT